MSRAARRKWLRFVRQEDRRQRLTKDEINANPEACRGYVIFGRSLEEHIITSAQKNAGLSKRDARARKRSHYMNLRREAEKKEIENIRKKHQESLIERMQNKMERATSRAGRIFRKSVQ